MEETKQWMDGWMDGRREEPLDLIDKEGERERKAEHRQKEVFISLFHSSMVAVVVIQGETLRKWPNKERRGVHKCRAG